MMSDELHQPGPVDGAGAMLGGWLGSHTALKFGARLIRPLLVVISLGLTSRLLWSYFSNL